MELSLIRDYMAVDRLPTSMCHASNILPLSDDRVLCAYFGGSFEGKEDTAIYYSLLKAGQSIHLGKLDVQSTAHWNPVLFRFLDGHIGLIFKVGNVIASWCSFICHSYDEGLSFTKPQELVPGDVGGRGPVRNKPLRLQSDRLLCPGSLEDGVWRAFVDISDDDLKTLHKSADLLCPKALLDKASAAFTKEIEVSEQSFSGKGIIQPSLYEDPSGVHMLLRSTVGWVLRSDSTDQGLSWCEPYKVSMPNNNSGLDCDYWNGTLYLVCNPIAANWGKRTPITLFSSQDGVEFKQEQVLDDQDAEFSYPCVRIYEHRLYISYTYKRQNIKILEFSLN